MGELARNTAMLKSFPITFTHLVLARQYQEMIRQGITMNTVGAASLMLFGGMLLGGIITQMKNLVYGRDLQRMDDAKFWLQAFMQAGGLGIYGDFIGSAQNRFGGGLAGTVAGPMAEFMGGPISIAASPFVAYGLDEKSNPGREAVNMLRRYTPGALVPFYLRLGYDRMVLDNAQRMLDPDSHRSFASKQQSLRRRTGQEFYWPPGGESRNPNFGAAFPN